MSKCLSAALLLLASAAVPIHAQTPGASSITPAAPGLPTVAATQLLGKADLSFSPIALGSVTTPAQFNLQRGGPTGCQQVECGFVDGGFVRHHFAADGRLVAKSFDAADYGYRSIFAVSIGSVRRMEDVLTNVRAFLPGVTIDCYNAVSGKGTPVATSSPADCTAVLDQGTLTLSFNGVGLLAGGRIAMNPAG